MEVSVEGRLSVSLTFCVSIVAALIVTPARGSDNPLASIKKDFLKGYKVTQQGKPGKAISSLEKIKDAPVAVRDYVLYYLGRAYWEDKKCDRARQVFGELVENYPESRWFSAADAQVRAQEACPPLEVTSIVAPSLNCSETEDVRDRADCWFSAREYPKAKDLYLTLPPDPKVFVRISQAAARSQDFKTAIRANEDLRRLFPKSREASEALRKIASLYLDSGQFEDAIRVYKDLAAKTKAKSEKRQYFERMGWCHFRLEQYESAVARYEDSLALEETPRSLYWKARSLDRMGRTEEAERTFQDIAQVYRGTYYGLRAVERLGGRLHGGKTSVAATLESWWTRLPNGIEWSHWHDIAEASRELTRVEELTSLGLLEDASVEARRARIKLGLRLPQDPKKIRKSSDGGFVFEGRSPKSEDGDYRIPYADHLLTAFKKASPLGIDPMLLYAMMRQESRFRETVVSPVGAIGLLQIMPSTGRKLAQDSGWEEYQPDWLYDPLTNIDLSVVYIKQLADLFKGRWYAIAASYNAGEKVVNEWVKQRSNLLEEEFIEEIPYQETRDYVMKVYTNWKAYRVIYEGSFETASR